MHLLETNLSKKNDKDHFLGETRLSSSQQLFKAYRTTPGVQYASHIGLQGSTGCTRKTINNSLSRHTHTLTYSAGQRN